MTTLKQYRLLSGYSAQHIANHMDVSSRTIYAWETGQRQISTMQLYHLLALYQVDIQVSDFPNVLPVGDTKNKKQ